MPFFVPFIMLFFALGVIPIISSFVNELTGNLPEWLEYFQSNLVYLIGESIAIAMMIAIAEVFFQRHLKGFGLNIKTIPRDFAAAAVNLLAVWPLIMAAMWLTVYFGERLWGPDYQIQRHEQLEILTENPQLPLQILIAVIAIVVAPVLEELLFRGLFQTTIRSYLLFRNGAWVAILVSSALFMTAHANYEHWSALFVLSMCLGYSYEKSGSLFRPIFIHSIFNAISIVAVLSS
jgi:membrane protease YdiL (CAAX protease family)